MASLSINDYAKEIGLHQKYEPQSESLSTESEEELTDVLLTELKPVCERLGVGDYGVLSPQQKRQLLDAAVTVLAPGSLSGQGADKLSRLLQSEKSKRTLTGASQLALKPFFRIGSTSVVLWRGDITTLKVDAIVNAANNQLLGCFQPMHACIDNAIHNRAGVQLRSDCEKLMSLQGSVEETGRAKVTRAYNLPSDFVIHTVGPIVSGRVTDKEEAQLASCYTSVLAACAAMDKIRSVALCAISTGVFGYPVEQATRVAAGTVINWIKLHPGALDTVIFNVFSDKDHKVYQSVLEEIEI